MDLQPNKTDGIYLPITNTRISASEWNQLVGSCMAFITAAGLTPDASDNEQFLNAFKTIAAGLEIVGANTNLSNLTATGEARFTTKADTDLGNVSVPYVTESYMNGTSWYRKWSDGRIEQGGHVSDDVQPATISLLIPFTSTNYQVFSNCTATGNSAVTGRNYIAYNKTTTQFSCAEGFSNNTALALFWDGSNDWLAVGY